jgi:hypothetical protein
VTRYGDSPPAPRRSESPIERRLAALASRASEIQPISSTEILVSALSTKPTKILWSPAISARASWLNPRSYRTRLTIDAIRQLRARGGPALAIDDLPPGNVEIPVLAPALDDECMKPSMHQRVAEPHERYRTEQLSSVA